MKELHREECQILAVHATEIIADIVQMETIKRKNCPAECSSTFSRGPERAKQFEQKGRG